MSALIDTDELLIEPHTTFHGQVLWVHPKLPDGSVLADENGNPFGSSDDGDEPWGFPLDQRQARELYDRIGDWLQEVGG